MQWRINVGWSGWTRIESLVISAPEASSQAPDSAPQVLGRGIDHVLYRFVWNGTSWVAYSWGLT